MIPLSRDKFLSIWQESPDFNAVLERTGLSYRAVAVRASRYRKAGYKIKYFKVKKPIIFVEYELDRR